jgi:hypothetical protein
MRDAHRPRGGKPDLTKIVPPQSASTDAWRAVPAARREGVIAYVDEEADRSDVQAAKDLRCAARLLRELGGDK